MKYVKLTIFLATTMLLSACSGGSIKFQKSPVDEIIKQYSTEQNFSIVLYDMDYDESANKYKHMYQIMIPKTDTIDVTTTEWKNVSEYFFNENVNNMGMEIAAKVDGKIRKTAAPAGYNHYVGNEKYGRWVQRDGGSFWEFYGKFAFMSSMFHMVSNPINRSYYNDYRGHYYSGRSYYGPNVNGRNYYGTRSNYNASRSTAWNSKPQTFKDKVRSQVSRSSSTSRSNFGTRTSRSTSRSSSSSMRSRGGGFGK